MARSGRRTPATTMRRTGKIGAILSSAASTMVAAMAGSMNHDGNETIFRAARPSVIASSSPPIRSIFSGSALRSLDGRLKWIITIAASASGLTAPFHNETSGLMYVLEGRLQLDAGGLDESLEAGDCVYVESDMALAWSAAGKNRCRVLAVMPGRAGK